MEHEEIVQKIQDFADELDISEGSDLVTPSDVFSVILNVIVLAAKADDLDYLLRFCTDYHLAIEAQANRKMQERARNMGMDVDGDKNQTF